MGLITGLINVITKKSSNVTLAASDFIFYKIVNFNEKANKYLLQCINTKATFLVSINDIILDIDILYGLHPVQACYVGIEYGIGIKQNPKAAIFLEKGDVSYSSCRYGTLTLHYQDRRRNLCFIDSKTQKNYIMDPRDIALSEKIITEFDATHAFYVGFMAGLKIGNPNGIYENIKIYNRPHLTLIKK